MRILSLLSFVVLISCSPKMTADQNATSKDQVLDYREKAYDILQVSQIKFKKNKPGDYVIASYIDKSKLPGSEPLKVAVLEVATNEVTYQQNLNNGSVKWLGDYTIEIVSPPGIPNGNLATVEDYTYIVDVKTGKKTKKLNVKVRE